MNNILHYLYLKYFMILNCLKRITDSIFLTKRVQPELPRNGFIYGNLCINFYVLE